jgi:CheY-like chemotaxis protein
MNQTPLILIVDDEPQNQKVLGSTLKKGGYSLILADNGTQALDLLKNKKPHLILLDIMMPGMDGFEVCKKIKQDATTKDIPVIFMTAHSETEKVIKGFQLGAIDYVTKPFKSEELVSRVKTHLKLKATEEQLRQKVKELETANRAKSEFLANMSHEIRTPMNGIIGFTQLAMKTKLTTQQLNYITEIESSAKALLGIINDILDFSKIEAGKLSMERINFSLGEVLDNLFNTLGLRIKEKGLELFLNINTNVPRILVGDPLRLREILIKLTTNALKFTKRGKIVISVELIKLETSLVKLRFSVKDTGIGISSEIMATLFDAFTQADSSITRKFGGTGLGLAICKSLVNLMDGDIWIESELGKGSTFYFTAVFGLQAETDLSHTQNKPASLTRDSFQGKRILLVEDNYINQLVATELMKSEGLVVEIANNGKEAVTAVANNEFDAVLMDLQMPEMDGYEATRIIRENQSELPIIAMTAHTMSSDKEKCMVAGMNDYVAKPIYMDILLSVLGKWIKPKA